LFCAAEKGVRFPRIIAAPGAADISASRQEFSARNAGSYGRDTAPQRRAARSQRKIVMKSTTKKTALALASTMMLGLAQHPATALALEPNSINQTIDTGGYNPDVPLNMQPGGAGIYDRYDAYRTPQGFPLPGWGYLRGAS
jgi:hypothetical protein